MVSSLFESSVFTAIAGIREQSSVIQTSGERASTGKRINRASDDVVGYIRSLRIQSTSEFLDARVVATRTAKAPINAAVTALENLLTSLNQVRNNAAKVQSSGNYALGTITHAQLARSAAAGLTGADADGTNLLTANVTVSLYVDGANDITVTGQSVGAFASAFFSAISNGTVATGLTAANIGTVIASIGSDIANISTFLTRLTAGRAAIQAVEVSAQRASSSAKASNAELLKTDIEFESTRLTAARAQRELAQRVIGVLNASQNSVLNIFG